MYIYNLPCVCDACCWLYCKINPYFADASSSKHLSDDNTTMYFAIFVTNFHFVTPFQIYGLSVPKMQLSCKRTGTKFVIFLFLYRNICKSSNMIRNYITVSAIAQCTGIYGSATALQASRVQIPLCGPFPILYPLSLSLYFLSFYCPVK